MVVYRGKAEVRLIGELGDVGPKRLWMSVGMREMGELGDVAVIGV